MGKIIIFYLEHCPYCVKARQAVAENGLNEECGLLVNSSRGIIYASNGSDFAVRAGEEAKKLKEKMSELLKEKGVI